MRSDPDPELMRHAILLARQGVEAGLGGPFGALVVRAGTVLGAGQNLVTSSADPTAHAEVVAIRAACKRLGTHVLAGCEIYASCEPCPMCLAAIHWARIERVWYGATRSDAAAIGFDDELLYEELARPLAERRLPARSLLRDEALGPFRLWREKPDRVGY